MGKRRRACTRCANPAEPLPLRRRLSSIGRRGRPFGAMYAAKGLVVKRTMLSAVSAAALSVALIASAPVYAASLNELASQGLAVLGISTPPPDSLSNDQVLKIMNVLSSSDSSAQQKEQIQTIIGENDESGGGVGKYGVGQLRSSVSSDLAALGRRYLRCRQPDAQRARADREYHRRQVDQRGEEGADRRGDGQRSDRDRTPRRPAAVGLDEGRPRQDRGRLRRRWTC